MFDHLIGCGEVPIRLLGGLFFFCFERVGESLSKAILSLFLIFKKVEHFHFDRSSTKRTIRWALRKPDRKLDTER